MIHLFVYKVNGKLMFPLCASCSKGLIKKCNHSTSERELEGTWVTLEIIESIKLGYKVTKIYEVWNYKNRVKYDPITKKGGLFTEYVNRFLKIKQEASGYPRWVKSENDKFKYIADYLTNEGIQLDKEKIAENTGLKTLSKLLLNSHWGRYAMNTDKTKCKFVKNPHELYNILYNVANETKDVIFPNDQIGICYYKDKKELHWGSNQTNVILAAFVTSQARLKLYEELRKFGKNILIRIQFFTLKALMNQNVEII